MTIQGMITGLKAHRRAAWTLALVAALLPATAAKAAIRIGDIGYYTLGYIAPHYERYLEENYMTPPIVPNYDEEGNYIGELQQGQLSHIIGRSECSDFLCLTSLNSISNYAVSFGNRAYGQLQSIASVSVDESVYVNDPYVDTYSDNFVTLYADQLTELKIYGFHTITGFNFERTGFNFSESRVLRDGCCHVIGWVNQESFSFTTRFKGEINIISRHQPVLHVIHPGNVSSISNLFWTATTVPEPGTWALMIAGFGMVGGALRSQRRRGAWQGGAPA